MPDYPFFFSYASADRTRVGRDSKEPGSKDYIRLFFNDLNNAMKGYGYSDGGFFDEHNLEGDWESALQAGLARSRVLVPLYSANYFLSNYCGKEWESFRERSFENKSGRFPDVTSSTVMRPILWKGQVAMPEGVGDFQVDFEGTISEYQDHGLEYIMSMGKYRDVYKQFVVRFAAKLLKSAKAQGAPKLRPVDDWDALNPPFPGNNRRGLKLVRYVFVAGMQDEMKNHHGSYKSYPLFNDRRDWKPFVPPHFNEEIGRIATGPAKADDRQCDLLDPASEDIMSQLQNARRLNNVIIIVVDPLSLCIGQLIKFLETVDQEHFPNSAVLVKWNTEDAEISAKVAEIRGILDGQFKGRMGRGEFHKGEISSPQGLEQAVSEALGGVQAKLMETEIVPSATGGGSAHAPTIKN